VEYSLNHLEDIFKRTVPPSEVAGIIVEPVQGEGGYIVPPKEFHRGLKDICEKHGILYIADEVQAGMGRTGKMFASDHFGVKPDIITMAKGIASGMPLGAVISSEKVMNWVPGAHASTFGGNPVSCRAALATIDLLEKKYIANAASQGKYIMTELAKMMKRHKNIGDIRGLGLMIGVEMVKDRTSKDAAPKLRDAIVDEAFKRGLLLLGCGPNSIRFSPPLIISREEAKQALKIYEEAVTASEKKRL
jgi:4-aminobutyrate aminotransferase